MERSTDELQRAIGYKFSDLSLLEIALTHSSFLNGREDIEHNERLEFLGDAVLELVISNMLFSKKPDSPEGELSLLRAAIVCEQPLYQSAMKLSLGEYMFFGQGEKKTGAAVRPSTMADAYEALIGAVYLDGGYDAACSFIMSTLVSRNISDVESAKDDKSALQEFLQRNGDAAIEYRDTDRCEDREGDMPFGSAVFCGGKKLGEGIGRSKKEAQQAAARDARVRLGLVKDDN